MVAHFKEDFTSWIADKKTCYDHILEFMTYSNVGKMFSSILGVEARELAVDCWIWIWEGSCTTRGLVKEWYGDILIENWKVEREARMSVKVASTYFLRILGTKNKRFKKFQKEVKEALMLEVEIKSTGEGIELNLSKEDKVLMLWNAGEIDTAEAMERLSLSSRQSLYNRFQSLMERLKLELLSGSTAE